MVSGKSQNENDIIEIALCLDDNYIMPSSALICSICENNDCSIIFYIINDHLLLENRTYLIEIIGRYNQRLHFIQVNENDYADCPVKYKGQPCYITLSAYYRLMLPNMLGNTISKVIYLDSDIIVRGSLLDLWNYDIDGYPLGAVIDSRTKHDEYYIRLDYDKNLNYFNSGVLLINLNYWRLHNISNKIFEFIKSNRERLILHDQDAINAVLQGNILQLPVKYNVQCAFYPKLNNDFINDNDIHEACNNPIIIHYSESAKPWYKECEHPLKDDFFYYLSKTKWCGLKPKHMKMNLKEHFWFLQHKVRVIKSKWKK